MIRPDKDDWYLRIAEIVAERGTCARRQVGCVIVDVHGYVLSMGYNGVAAGVPHCIDHPCRGVGHPSGQGLDDCEAIHAEQNALVRLKEPFNVHTVYVTHSPCVSCTKLILGTSAERIVFRHAYPDQKGKELWEKSGRRWIHCPTYREPIG